MKKIFVVGGGTGGHFFPAISIGKELQNRGYGVYVLTDKRCKKYIRSLSTDSKELKFKIITCDYFKKSFLQNIIAFFRITFGIFESLTLIVKHRPKAVIGFGGYPSVPTLYAAKMLGIPIILHEQNSFFGKANLVFAKHAKLIALSFAETLNLPDQLPTVLTGNPIRSEIYKIDIQRDFTNLEKFKILICGGSQGAEFFDNLIPNTMKILKENHKDIQLSITQQAPTHDHEKIRKVYNNLKIQSNIQEFFNNMDEQFKSHHLIISRSGASTISEIIATGIPSILIPFPFAANNHQFHNAKFLSSKKASIMFEQTKLSPGLLANQIMNLVSNPASLTKMSKTLFKMKQNSTQIFADKIELIANKKI